MVVAIVLQKQYFVDSVEGGDVAPRRDGGLSGARLSQAHSVPPCGSAIASEGGGSGCTTVGMRRIVVRLVTLTVRGGPKGRFP